MINLFFGENSFEVDQAVKQAVSKETSNIEIAEGYGITAQRLRELLFSQSLFALSHTVVIKRLAENKPLWNELPAILEQLSEEPDLFFIEDGVDKRTTTYKWLQKNAQVREFPMWTDRERGQAEEWARAEAKKMGFTLTHAAAKTLVDRAGFNQWRLYHALEKLALLDEITDQTIEQTIDRQPDESVFSLLDTALKGDAAGLRRLVASVSRTDDAYRTFGLLASQVMQLVSLVLGHKSAAAVAKDTGAWPVSLARLAPQAKRLHPAEAKRLLEKTADTDRQLKSTSVDPWVLVERLLGEIAAIS